jgi:hypothetical protein
VSGVGYVPAALKKHQIKKGSAKAKRLGKMKPGSGKTKRMSKGAKARLGRS